MAGCVQQGPVPDEGAILAALRNRPGVLDLWVADGVPARVGAALEELWARWLEAADMPRGTESECAVRAERFALVYARRAGWWGVLAGWTFSAAAAAGVDSVYGTAAVAARRAERDSARFWRAVARENRAAARDQAASCRALADGDIGRVLDPITGRRRGGVW